MCTNVCVGVCLSELLKGVSKSKHAFDERSCSLPLAFRKICLDFCKESG